MVNTVEKTLFFSEALVPKQCQRTTKWCGSYNVKTKCRLVAFL